MPLSFDRASSQKASRLDSRAEAVKGAAGRDWIAGTAEDRSRLRPA
jgi:hypothetical protein